MAGFNTAVTGLKAASQMLDVAGNNIANSSTVGFKSSRTEFADIYATSVVGAGASNQPGSGVTVSDISQDFSAGTIEFTNNNLDLAINGSGFFQLDDGQGGITYTRAGTFELDKDGFIVSKNGKNLQGYGLDALGNVLPLQDLAVTQKESPPKATETIDLSFNIDSSADATQLNPVFDKTDPGSYTYSTTVETVDSLGNSNSIRFYVVEQRPVREIFQYDVSGLTPTDEAASATLPDIDALLGNEFTIIPVAASRTMDLTALAGVNFDDATYLTPSLATDPSSLVGLDTTAGATINLTYTEITGVDPVVPDAATTTTVSIDLDTFNVTDRPSVISSLQGALDGLFGVGAFVVDAGGVITPQALTPAVGEIYNISFASGETSVDTATPTLATDTEAKVVGFIGAGDQPLLDRGENATIDVSYVDADGANVTGSITLSENWADLLVSDISVFAGSLQGLLDAEFNTGTFTVDDTTGEITLDLDAGSSFTLGINTDTSDATISALFLGNATLQDEQTVEGGTSFDFTLTDINGDAIQTFSGASITGGPFSSAATAATALETAINGAINTELNTNTTYVEVNEVLDADGLGTGAFSVTLVADEWVNSVSGFSIGNVVNNGTDTNSTVDGDLLEQAFGLNVAGVDALDASAGTPEDMLISGIEISFEDLLGLPASITEDIVKRAEFRNLDPRIDLDTLSYDPATGILSFETYAYATQSGDMVVEGRGELQSDGSYLNPTELDLVGGETIERPANRVETFTLADIFPPNLETGVEQTTTRYQLTIGGVPVVLPVGRTLIEVGETLESMERALIEKNPDLESVSFDRNTGRVSYTWKADAGNPDPLILTGNVVNNPGTSVGLFTSSTAEEITGDNSFQAQYRMYGFLNDTEQLDLGKIVDPGEAGFETDATEVGAVLVSFNPSTGTLEGINGSSVSSAGIAPRITILGADPANPSDETLDSDVDSLAGIQLYLTGTTQFASESIVKSAAQDGYPKGDLIGVTFAETGEMVASFSNGQRQNLGLVAIASFENQSGLSSAGSTEWIATLASGAAILNPPGTGLNGTLRSAALESSNVDLSAELVKLIEAQRNFQANSKTLETQNTVTQAILQI